MSQRWKKRAAKHKRKAREQALRTRQRNWKFYVVRDLVKNPVRVEFSAETSGGCVVEIDLRHRTVDVR